MKFNTLQYTKLDLELADVNLTAEALNVNEDYESLKKDYKLKFNLPSVKTFSFTQDGFFALFMQLDGVIAVSLGESEAIVNGAKLAKKHGKNIIFLDLNKDGSVNFTLINKSFDFIFISSYVTDTYFKVDLEKVKELSDAKIISNVTAVVEYKNSDILLLDAYKLCGQGGQGVIIYDDEFEDSYLGDINLNILNLCLKGIENRKLNNNSKDRFFQKFEEYFKDNLYIFVDPKSCLEYTLHVGLKGIKARELIRSLALHDIFLSNGEGCSLGLMQPSRVIQVMKYEELQSRWSISLDFTQDFDDEQIDLIVKLIYKKYRQIKALL